VIDTNNQFLQAAQLQRFQIFFGHTFGVFIPNHMMFHSPCA